MPSDPSQRTGRFGGVDQTFVVGARAFEDMLALIDERGWGRLLLLTGPRTSRSAAFAEVAALLGDRVVARHDQVGNHAPTIDTERLAAEHHDAGLDAIVAFGGGSVSDTAKGISILLAEGGRLEDHCSVFEPPASLSAPVLEGRKIPVLSIPTTLSGAEVTPGGGSTTPAGVKRVFWDPQVASRIVCLDPRAVAETPRATLVSTGANALAHCAEGLYSRTRTPISDALAVEGTQMLARGLARLAGVDGRGPDHHTAMDLLCGAALSGVVISNARVCVHHAFCHVLGARLGLAHGDANAVMLPHSLRFNEPVTADAQRAFAGAIHAGAAEVEGFAPAFADGGGLADAPPDTVARFLAMLGAPWRLRDVGAELDQLGGVAEEVLQDRGLYFNPRSVSEADELLPVLQAAW